jgi:phage regulator Rha-like protein
MLTTLEAAEGMQHKHSKLMRDIDRVRSILPPEFAETAFTPDAQISPTGKRQRFFHLTRDVLPFLFMGQATKHEILWMMDAINML